MTETRAVVTWEGPGEPIVLTLYGPEGEVAVPLLPKRAVTLAQELLTCGDQGGPGGPMDPRRSRSACWGRPGRDLGLGWPGLPGAAGS